MSEFSELIPALFAATARTDAALNDLKQFTNTIAMTQTTTPTHPAWTDQTGISPYTSGNDFSLFELNGAFHWEGHNAYEDYCSEDGFADINAAIADVIYSLSRLDGESDEDAVQLVFELGLPGVEQETRDSPFPTLED